MGIDATPAQSPDRNKEVRTMLIQNLRTDNDRNGNPRRLWLIYGVSEGVAEIVAVVDEGYEGRRCLLDVLSPAVYASAIELPAVDITPKEYSTRKRARS